MTLPILKSELLEAVPNIRHGFFTRQGGVSTGIYESLNVGKGSQDDPDCVAENRTRVKGALGASSLHTLHQIHSARVVECTGTKYVEADGHYTHKIGQALGVLTADCVPVLLAAEDGSQIAAVHAGWKGTVSGILKHAVACFNARPLAAIGPAIAQESYEVGQDVFGAAQAPRFFARNSTDGKYQFDLTGLVADHLHAAGAKEIDHVKYDTYAQDGLFFSYRRSTHKRELDYGRQISAIMIAQ